MILSLEELRQQDFMISGVNILHQKPVYRKLVQKSRKVNGFLYILRGDCRYTSQNGTIDLSPGSVIYLPLGSTHQLTVSDGDFEFIRIDFTITVNGENVLFSDGPLKMCRAAPREFSEAVQAMEDKYQIVHDSLGKTELICKMLRELCDSSVNSQKERLSPAVLYLMENLTAKVECSRLAESCNLSSSQFYNLFHEEYRMTPLQYRDTLLVRKAAALLQDGSLSVAQVADMLGFESASYFSRFFKKNYGISPSGFLKAEQ